MESGLKERLIGATVLVVLGVLLIPLVLDGPEEGTPQVQATALELPTDDVATDAPTTRRQTISLDGSARATASAEPGGAPSAAIAPAADSVGGDPNEAERARATVAPSLESPRLAGQSGSAQRADAVAGDADGAGPDRVAAPAATKAPSQSAATAGKWFVQLGSFGDIENARRLAGRVSTFGYDADVTQFPSGGRTLNRVRVGPSNSRDEAAAVASSLTAHGFVAQVVSAD